VSVFSIVWNQGFICLFLIPLAGMEYQHFFFD
jgi:hypothetical protein